MDQDENYWKNKLSKKQYEVLRMKGTEQPFTGELLHNSETGVYKCGACQADLFKSDKKYDSGSGWPSFSDVLDGNAVELKNDGGFGMTRTEVLCKNCGSHLGHVFDDGPTDTGKRYCINSASLGFKKE